MKGFRLEKLLWILMLGLLILNTGLLAWNLEFFHLPGEKTPLDSARQETFLLIDYLENITESLGLAEREAVSILLGDFHSAVYRAKTVEELDELALRYGSKLQSCLLDEKRKVQKEAVYNIIAEYQGEISPGNFLLTVDEKGETYVQDENGTLPDKVRLSLEEHPQLEVLLQPLDVQIKNGQAQIITTQSFVDRLQVYQDRVEVLEKEFAELQSQAGFARMTGEGIIIKVYDVHGGHRNEQIVHDSDIRRIVNELFAAEARGIQVGGQRLTAVSSIRCAGPTILVNQKPIAVDPVIIKAVGPPDVLASALRIVINELKAFGVTIEVEELESITLESFN